MRRRLPNSHSFEQPAVNRLPLCLDEMDAFYLTYAIPFCLNGCDVLNSGVKKLFINRLQTHTGLRVCSSS